MDAETGPTTGPPLPTADGPAPGATPPSPGEPSPLPAPPRRLRLVSLVVGIVVMASVGGVWMALREDDAPATSGVEEPAAPEAPVSLRAEPDAFQVTLTWGAPAGGGEVVRYYVYRDGRFVKAVEPVSPTYVDTSVRPGERYTYEVEARAQGQASARVAVDVETPTPRLADARVEGTFHARLVLVSSAGYEETPRRASFVWHFKPRCDEGACDVRWRDVHERSLRMNLARRGPRYSGSGSGNFNTLCGDTPTTSDVTIVLRVVKARAIEGEWRAARLEGRLTHAEAAQLGCVSSRATLSVKATIAAF